MTVKMLFVATAVISLANGIVTLVSPATQLSLYGVALNAGTAHMAQWAGLGSVVVGLLAWFGSRNEAPEVERVFLGILLIYHVAAAALSTLGAFRHLVGGGGWLLGVMTGSFAIAYAFFLNRDIWSRWRGAT